MSASARSATSRLASEARARTSPSRHAASRPARSGGGSSSGATGTWGGARAGAGRPRKGTIASEPHKTRPLLAARHPVHIVARLVRITGTRARFQSVRSPAPRSTALRSSARTLARSDLDRALRRALSLSLGRSDFRIIHLAQLRDRVELVVEADDKLALARGMQGFQVSAAKAINRLVGRRGAVFPDRYRMRILRTRADVRTTIGGLPRARTNAWPQTWLLRIELPRAWSATHPHDATAPRRHWMRTRADEHS